MINYAKHILVNLSWGIAFAIFGIVIMFLVALLYFLDYIGFVAGPKTKIKNQH